MKQINHDFSPDFSRSENIKKKQRLIWKDVLSTLNILRFSFHPSVGWFHDQENVSQRVGERKTFFCKQEKSLPPLVGASNRAPSLFPLFQLAYGPSPSQSITKYIYS